jgi:hypothetical protein
MACYGDSFTFLFYSYNNNNNNNNNVMAECVTVRLLIQEVIGLTLLASLDKFLTFRGKLLNI